MLTDAPAIEVREPVGNDELFVLETQLTPVAALVALARRVATVDGHALDWEQIAAAGIGAIALAIRRAWKGDNILSDARCLEPGCGERVDVSFSTATYLGHHRGRWPRNVTAAEDGWCRLTGSQARFRIPSVADLLAAADGVDPAAVLASRCLQPVELPARSARAVHRALDAMAPSLDGLVGGRCPTCGAEVALRFDPVTYTLLELRHTFAGVYRETHALASAYGWAEETILGLTRSRRQRYAEMIFEDYRAARQRATW